MPVLNIAGRKVVRGPRRTVELTLELYPDVHFKNPVTGPDVVIRATMLLGQDKFESQAIAARPYLFDGQFFDVTVEGVLAHLFIEHLIPKMIAQLKDEYIEAVQAGTFPPL